MRALQYAWRRLWSTRGVTALAMLTMTLGIAATTAVFSVANAVLLRPLPYPDPAGLVMIWNHWTGWPSTWLAEAEFLDYRDKARSFSAVGAFTGDSRNLTGGDTPERVRVGIASAGVFTALGTHPQIGRVYSVTEDRPGGARVAVISDGLWRRRFAADPNILGKSILLDDSISTVIGVMPPGFQLPLDFGADPMDLWLPLALGPVNPTMRGGHYLNAIARLRPGVTPAAAEAEVQAMGRQMIADYPGAYAPEFGAFARSVTSQVLGDIRPTLVLLLAAVACVLLIACANVTNLLLSRAHARQREIVVRTALGASPARLVRQLLSEGLLLSLTSGAIGLALAAAALRGFAAIAPATIPRVTGVGVDLTVVLFITGVSCLTGIGCALAPALHAIGADLHTVLKTAGRAVTIDRAGDRLRRALIAGEVALSVVLLIGAGLLLKSFARLHAVDPGFSPANVLTVRVSVPAARYPDNQSVRAFYQTAVQRLGSLPGVTAAGLVRVLPMTDIMGDWGFAVEGRKTDKQFAYAADWQIVSPDYFRVMGIARHSGRAFSVTDDAHAPGVVAINEALAHRVWPDGNAIGQRILLGGTSDSLWRTVTAVVANVHHRGLDAEPRPEMYIPHAQWPHGEGTASRTVYLVLRSVRDPRALAGNVRRTVQALDPNLPLSNIRTMDEVLAGWTAARRLALVVLAALAAAAATLAAIGLYGVVGYAVAQRTSEIGIRRALGADAASVMALVARQNAAPVVIGVGVGLLGALAASRLVRAMLFQVSSGDVTVYAIVPVMLGVVAVLATYVPARRATRVDPLTALRSE